MMSFKNRLPYYMILILLQPVLSYCLAADGTVVLNSVMPGQAVSAIATQSVVLTSGFHATGSAGTFDASIGAINSVYPLVPVAAGSTALLVPGANEYAPSAKNCVKTTVPFIALTDATQLNAANSLMTIAYTDGLGQTNMTVQKSITPGKKDLVSVANYDCYGKLSNQWLPTPMGGTSLSDPGMVMQQAQNFYADNMPYATITRSTDLQSNDDGTEGQSIQVCNAGEVWHNGNKTLNQEMVSNEYDSEYPQLIIRQYGVAGDNVVLYDDRFGLFAAKVKHTTDEDGHETYTFTDAQERTLLQRTVNNGENHDTYFVYDDMGHLRFVLSPEASDQMSAATTYSFGTDIKNDNGPLALFAYAYKYDERGRCIAKKLPGKYWTNMMYDMADHLAFSQDGNQSTASQWTYYKYDVLDRLIQSGTTTLTPTDVSTMQTTCSNTAAVETYQPGAGYTSNFPSGTNPMLLTQNFYDTYDYLTIPAYTSMKTTLTYDAATTGFDARYVNQVDGVDIATQGMLTGTTVALLDNSMTLFNALYYDDQGRVVQTRANNHLNGYDDEYFHYNFSGQVLNKRHVHNTPYITSPITENYRLQYDNASRLVTVHHALNTQNEVLMDSLVYDETGRVSKKILHGGIQTINYAYNIRSWLKSINSENFAETLYYQDSPNGNACYNGNISATTFGTGSDKTYSFAYDQLNRLTGATDGTDQHFSENVGSYDKNGNIQSIKRNGYVYDNAYNVVQGPIDDLTMTYNGNQLKSVSDAADQGKVIGTNDFLDKQDPNSPAEYLYDANGNQTGDLNKGIAWIRYNLLNLPQKVQFSNGTKNEYLYDASGVKHRASYNFSRGTSLIPLGNTDPSLENTAPTTYETDYCGNYEYEKPGTSNPILKRILTPEGYIQTFGQPISSMGGWSYVYSLKDHLGSTRVSLTSDYLSNAASKVYTASAQTDYYPFGMERSNSAGANNSGTNPYLYSGKEVERMNGLNEYDFIARWQDHAVPGFTTPDPLAENRPNESPYSYCGNNPVNRIDPTGMEYYWNDDGTEPVWIDGDEDVDGYDYHSTDYDEQSGEDDNYHWVHHGPPDSGSPDSQDYTNEANYSLYGFAPPAYQDHSGTSNGGSGGNSNQNSNSGQSGNNQLSKLPAAAGMTVDVMSTTGATIKVATEITESAVSHALTRPTTIIGAVVAGGPALYNIYNDLKNGNGVNVNDGITVLISGAALALEFSPEGAAVNVGSAIVSLGGVVWDAYTMTHPENR